MTTETFYLHNLSGAQASFERVGRDTIKVQLTNGLKHSIQFLTVDQARTLYNALPPLGFQTPVFRQDDFIKALKKT